ncbi:Uncharacterised protein [Mycobacterium tuberculosis]|nr:Uncharacterised protein [Mycobacterium tuberculosis]
MPIRTWCASTSETKCKNTLPVFPVLAPTSLPWAMARRYALSSCEAVC